MGAPKEVRDLVKRFEQNSEAYLSGQYNETQLRREFLDPFFKALGWDIDNVSGYAEAYKDVIHEDAIRIGGFIKAPDYCFRIGGMRKFFVEAKKPSVSIAEEMPAAYQLRRYAWSAKLPLSILTDFEEFAVYDCRIKPNKADASSTARVFYCTYRDFDEKWEWIASIFSRDAVLKGSFDKYADANKAKRGTSEVDNDILATIEGWRNDLAHNIALRNPDLSQRELNFAVQRIIDRILFLRICEDRGIENYGRLLALTNGPEIYPRLCELFHDADARYNSGLFHFKAEKERNEPPDELTLRLGVDDKLLGGILKQLYYPESPYEFTVLPADILGQVYEQFLGKVIRLTAGHHAVVEDKPEVKKAGGVYYTPTYIVDYIVKQTVGKLLEGKLPKQVAKLHILDPACGSGSFLINAYQHLLDWHRDWYVGNKPESFAKGRNPVLVQTTRGWKLTIAERKRILLNNIYGVDIDPQAVEVTKLSLLLKVLEGENDQTIQPFLRLFHERALPDLGDNIKCGNSLIGSDAFKQTQLSLLPETDQYRINVFDWNQGFPEVMESGGFDAVIGNPPYIRIQMMKEWAPIEVEIYKTLFKSAHSGNYDIYVVFIERALSFLCKSGLTGFILPHKFFNAQYGEAIRSIISEGRHLSHVVHFGDQQVFKGAITYTCLLFLIKSGIPECRYSKVDNFDAWRIEGQCMEGTIQAEDISAAEWNFMVGKQTKVKRHIQAIPTKLGQVAHIFQGLVTGDDKVFICDKKLTIESGIIKPFLTTGSLSSYSPLKSEARIIFPYEIINNKAYLLPLDLLKRDYPKAWNYLLSHREELMNRERGKWRHDRWYAYGRSQNLTQMNEPKLIIQVTAQKPTILFDDHSFYMTGGGSGPFYGIRPKDPKIPIKYLMGILNSSLFGWIIKSQSTNLRGGYIKFSKQYIESAPIAYPDETELEKTQEMVNLVDNIIDMKKRAGNAKAPHELEVLQRQIAETNRQIDQLVYDLYSLTDNEIKIVEESIS
jgi:hypothetical protein